MKTSIQRSFAPLKVVLPRPVWSTIRSVMTAVLTPLIFSRSTGHFRSSLSEKAVTRNGKPLPWYTYPCIDLLAHRNLTGRKVLEFGGGQSTLWWAERAAKVVSFEGDPEWYAHINHGMPTNVELRLISVSTRESHLGDVRRIIGEMDDQKFDVIIIDAEFREDLVDTALNFLAEDGALICDDAESYDFYAVTKGLKLSRVDFFGFAPGVVLPHCTSVYFRDRCFLFDPNHPIPDMANEI
jgi:hypothetical protein